MKKLLSLALIVALCLGFSAVASADLLPPIFEKEVTVINPDGAASIDNPDAVIPYGTGCTVVRFISEAYKPGEVNEVVVEANGTTYKVNVDDLDGPMISSFKRAQANTGAEENSDPEDSGDGNRDEEKSGLMKALETVINGIRNVVNYIRDFVTSIISRIIPSAA